MSRKARCSRRFGCILVPVILPLYCKRVPTLGAEREQPVQALDWRLRNWREMEGKGCYLNIQGQKLSSRWRRYSWVGKEKEIDSLP